MKTLLDLLTVTGNTIADARLNVDLRFGDGRDPISLPVADILVDDRGGTDLIVELDGSEFQPKSDWKYYTYCRHDYFDVEDALASGGATLIPNLHPNEVEACRKLIGALNDENLNLNLRLVAHQTRDHFVELDA
jgi:hypothetical protein